jgi:methionine-S-sulfoxide reductase
MKKEIAMFGMGCFWEPDFYFSHLKGVLKVTVGYSGGAKENPTYHDLGDHIETVKIEFDANIITYQELLKHFFEKHDPTFKQKTQYRSVVFYFNDKQKELAEQEIANYQEKNNVKVSTSLEKATKFYKAEDYHQKYYEKNNVRGIC